MAGKLSTSTQTTRATRKERRLNVLTQNQQLAEQKKQEEEQKRYEQQQQEYQQYKTEQEKRQNAINIIQHLIEQSRENYPARLNANYQRQVAEEFQASGLGTYEEGRQYYNASIESSPEYKTEILTYQEQAQQENLKKYGVKEPVLIPRTFEKGTGVSVKEGKISTVIVTPKETYVDKFKTEYLSKYQPDADYFTITPKAKSEIIAKESSNVFVKVTDIVKGLYASTMFGRKVPMPESFAKQRKTFTITNEGIGINSMDKWVAIEGVRQQRLNDAVAKEQAIQWAKLDKLVNLAPDEQRYNIQEQGKTALKEKLGGEFISDKTTGTIEYKTKELEPSTTGYAYQLQQAKKYNEDLKKLGITPTTSGTFSTPLQLRSFDILATEGVKNYALGKAIGGVIGVVGTGASKTSNWFLTGVGLSGETSTKINKVLSVGSGVGLGVGLGGLYTVGKVQEYGTYNQKWGKTGKELFVLETTGEVGGLIASMFGGKKPQTEVKPKKTKDVTPPSEKSFIFNKKNQEKISKNIDKRISDTLKVNQESTQSFILKKRGLNINQEATSKNIDKLITETLKKGQEPKQSFLVKKKGLTMAETKIDKLIADNLRTGEAVSSEQKSFIIEKKFKPKVIVKNKVIRGGALGTEKELTSKEIDQLISKTLNPKNLQDGMLGKAPLKFKVTKINPKEEAMFNTIGEVLGEFKKKPKTSKQAIRDATMKLLNGETKQPTFIVEGGALGNVKEVAPKKTSEQAIKDATEMFFINKNKIRPLLEFTKDVSVKPKSASDLRKLSLKVLNKKRVVKKPTFIVEGGALGVEDELKPKKSSEQAIKDAVDKLLSGKTKQPLFIVEGGALGNVKEVKPSQASQKAIRSAVNKLLNRKVSKEPTFTFELEPTIKQGKTVANDKVLSVFDKLKPETKTKTIKGNDIMNNLRKEWKARENAFESSSNQILKEQIKRIKKPKTNIEFRSIFGNIKPEKPSSIPSTIEKSGFFGLNRNNLPSGDEFDRAIESTFGKSINRVKKDTRLNARIQSKLNERLYNLENQKTETEQKSENKQRPRERIGLTISQVLNQKLESKQEEKLITETTTTQRPRTAFKPFAFDFGLEQKRKLSRKLRKKKVRAYAYLPDFTARALGLEPIKVTRSEAERLIRKFQTGFEVRRGAILK